MTIKKAPLSPPGLPTFNNHANVPKHSRVKAFAQPTSLANFSVRKSLIAASIVSNMQSVYAADGSTLQTVAVQARKLSDIDSMARVEKTQAENRT